MARLKQAGLTLLELAVAMSLMGVVGLSFAYLYVNSQRYLTQSVLASAAQGEASYAMEHIKRQLLDAVDVTWPAERDTVARPQLNFRIRRTMADPAVGVPAVYSMAGTTLQYSIDGGPATPIASNLSVMTFKRNSRVQLGVDITARQRTAGGDARETSLHADVGVRGIF